MMNGTRGAGETFKKRGIISPLAKVGAAVLIALFVIGVSSGVASAEQQWVFRFGVAHVSNFHTEMPFNCNGVAGQLQYNFGSNFFVQGTVIYSWSGMTWGITGPVGLVIFGVQY